MKSETWKDVAGYEGIYQCSDLGRVRTVARTIVCKNGMPKPLPQRTLKPHFNSNGYLWVYLWKDGLKRFRFVHRLIAEVFVPNPEAKLFVNHIVGVKTRNEAVNLEWSTRKENISHAFTSGLMSHAGEKNSQSKLTSEDVVGIRRDRDAGLTARELAVKYTISRRRIYDVVNRRCWRQAA